MRVVAVAEKEHSVDGSVDDDGGIGEGAEGFEVDFHRRIVDEIAGVLEIDEAEEILRRLRLVDGDAGF